MQKLNRLTLGAALALVALNFIGWTQNSASDWFKGVIYAGSAKTQLTDSSGNLLAGGTLTVAGNTALAGTLAVTGAATFASTVSVTGNETLASGVFLTDYVSVAATGTTGGVATALTHTVNGLTGVTNAGVILPAVTGSVLLVTNTTAGTLKVYPPTGGQVNTGGANTAMSVATLKTYMCVAATAALYYCAGN